MKLPVETVAKMFSNGEALHTLIGTESKVLIAADVNGKLNLEPDAYYVLRLSENRQDAAATLPQLVEARNKTGLTREDLAFNVIDRQTFQNIAPGGAQEITVRDGDFLISASQIIAYDKQHGEGKALEKIKAMADDVNNIIKAASKHAPAPKAMNAAEPAAPDIAPPGNPLPAGAPAAPKPAVRRP